MTKADLVDAVQSEAELSRREAHAIVETFFHTIKEQLIHKGKVKLSRFGNFEVRPKRARAGRNPQTGEPIEIQARRTLVFKPSRLLRAALDANLEAHVASSNKSKALKARVLSVKRPATLSKKSSATLSRG